MVWPWRWFLTQAELSHLQWPEKDETPQGYIRRTLILLRYRSRARLLLLLGFLLFFGGPGLFAFLGSQGWHWVGRIGVVASMLFGAGLLGFAGDAIVKIDLALRKLGTHDDLP